MERFSGAGATSGGGRPMDRRAFLRAAGASAGLALLGPAARAVGAGAEAAASEGGSVVSTALESALEQSGFVYVSPLRSDGSESRCHGEVWYGWLDGAVVLITSRESWKGRALARGLSRSRIWVGDHGRWKQLIGRNEEFRTAPHFEAQAEVVRDDALLERLLALYERKYPSEIGQWRDRMRAGYRDGSRVLIRYVPEPGTTGRGPAREPGEAGQARRART
jgi:hypothetical protein